MPEAIRTEANLHPIIDFAVRAPSALSSALALGEQIRKRRKQKKRARSSNPVRYGYCIIGEDGTQVTVPYKTRAMAQRQLDDTRAQQFRILGREDERVARWSVKRIALRSDENIWTDGHNPENADGEWIEDEELNLTDRDIEEGMRAGTRDAKRRTKPLRAPGAPRLFLVSWYSPARGKRTGFMRPIEAHTQSEAKAQAKAMIINDPKARNFVAKEANIYGRNPGELKRVARMLRAGQKAHENFEKALQKYGPRSPQALKAQDAWFAAVDRTYERVMGKREKQKTNPGDFHSESKREKGRRLYEMLDAKGEAAFEELRRTDPREPIYPKLFQRWSQLRHAGERSVDMTYPDSLTYPYRRKRLPNSPTQNGVFTSKSRDESSGSFRVGDTVVLTRDPNAWWYTVTEVLPFSHVRLRFGNKGVDAGSFHSEELQRVKNVARNSKIARNPRENAHDRFAKMFHGQASGAKRNMTVSHHAPDQLARLGQLPYIKMLNRPQGGAHESPKHACAQCAIIFDPAYAVNPSNAHAMLAASVRKRLVLAGADVWRVGKILRAQIEAQNPKFVGHEIGLGKIEVIPYVTQEKHSNSGQVILYYHQTAEETGKRGDMPQLRIDRNGMFYIPSNSGRYTIDSRGIIN